MGMGDRVGLPLPPPKRGRLLPRTSWVKVRASPTSVASLCDWGVRAFRGGW